ncbi:hypothetical protein A3709_19045 [Halioglobus sp. HI00S01]|nr:hypothetical protein A3709_19045 [Halioglobus sp. HI00S01]
MRGIYEWLVDCDLTPYVWCKDGPGCQIPPGHTNDAGDIILNISTSAVRDLEISNEGIAFKGFFDNELLDVYVSMACVRGIYARENGKGQAFADVDDEYPDGTGRDSAASVPGKTPVARPQLRIVQ